MVPLADARGRRRHVASGRSQRSRVLGEVAQGRWRSGACLSYLPGYRIAGMAEEFKIVGKCVCRRLCVAQSRFAISCLRIS